MLLQSRFLSDMKANYTPHQSSRQLLLILYRNSKTNHLAAPGLPDEILVHSEHVPALCLQFCGRGTCILGGMNIFLGGTGLLSIPSWVLGTGQVRLSRPMAWGYPGLQGCRWAQIPAVGVMGWTYQSWSSVGWVHWYFGGIAGATNGLRCGISMGSVEGVDEILCRNEEGGNQFRIQKTACACHVMR